MPHRRLKEAALFAALHPSGSYVGMPVACWDAWFMCEKHRTHFILQWIKLDGAKHFTRLLFIDFSTAFKQCHVLVAHLLNG